MKKRKSQKENQNHLPVLVIYIPFGFFFLSKTEQYANYFCSERKKSFQQDLKSHKKDRNQARKDRRLTEKTKQNSSSLRTECVNEAMR